MSSDIKIIVIDDEQVIVDSVVRLCSDEGFQVDTALDANTALKKIEKNGFQLIITDLMMSETDGFQFINIMRKKHIYTPIIVTTGFSTVENAVKSLYEGAIDFLPKPFTVDELMSCIQRGLKYSILQKHLGKTDDSNKIGIEMVPCPVSYYRLGYNTWAHLEDDGSLKLGVTDLFIKTIGSIKDIELFSIDEEIIQGNPCALVQSDSDLIHKILAPITGRIIEKNMTIVEQHDLIEKDPYFKGWFYTIIPSDLDYEIKHLIPCSSDRL